MNVSVGEALSRRKLRKIGVGYETGQYSAVLIGKEDAILSFVDRAGAVCIVACELTDDGWIHREVMVRATQNFAETRNLPRSRPLADLELRAIQAALKKKVPDQDGQT